MSRLVTTLVLLFKLMTSFSQADNELVNDTTHIHKVINDISITKGSNNPIISVEDSTIGIFFFYFGSGFKNKRIKTFIFDTLFNKIIEKEQELDNDTYDVLIEDALDDDKFWTFFSMTDVFLKEIVVSKQTGHMHMLRLIKPKILKHYKTVKHEGKIYLLTFDKTAYILYRLEHGKIITVGEGKMPETGIKRLNFSTLLEDAYYVRSTQKAQLSDAAYDNKNFTFKNNVIFTFNHRIDEKEALFGYLNFDLTTAKAEFHKIPFPATTTLGRKVTFYYNPDKNENFIDPNLRNFASYFSSNGKLFLTSMSDKEMNISIYEWETGQKITEIINPIRNLFTMKNSDIINETSGFNFWSGKEEVREKDTLTSVKFWEILLLENFNLLAHPQKDGYDLTIGLLYPTIFLSS